MQAERFARLRALYEAVVDLAPAERAAALARLESDTELTTEALALCTASDRDRTGALSRPRDALLPDVGAPQVQPQPGDVFGAWRVVEEIGRGGMGRVYRVERSDGSYAQTAALKFIKGVARANAIAHFTRERQLLASLAHPNIARLLDGGASAQGQPYLVMEYVDGRPIDDYCRDASPGRDAVLDLFVSACAGVSHAHRQLVVHCDLKPSNMLVNAQRQPVLLDFGIAQLADQLADGATPSTQAAAVGFTPGYASPEQCRGERVGTASDVFSLGVVLREMLDAAGIAADRELAAIVAHATDEDAGRRYASVDALCDDIARYRALRPVRALPATATYRLSRFVRRRWPALAVGVGIVALSAVFTSQVVSERQRARAAEQVALDERDRALRSAREARSSEAVARETAAFLLSVFDGANPDAGSGTVSIEALLAQALQRVERDLADQPATRAQMSAALAEALFLIGQIDRGEALYAQAIALERAQPRPLVLAQMLIGHAAANQRTQPGKVRYDDVREALRLVEAHAGDDALLRLELTRSAARILENDDPAEATPLFEATVDLARTLTPDSAALADAIGNLGWHDRGRGRYDEAIARLQEASALRVRLFGEGHEDHASELESIANTMGLAGRYDEADALFREALALRRNDGSSDTVAGAWSRAQYASMLRLAGRSREALPLFDEIFAIAARKVPDNHVSLAVWKHNFATTLADAGELDRAVAMEREAMAVGEIVWKADDPIFANVLVALGRTLGASGCDAEAGAALDRSVAIFAAKRPREDADLNDAKVERARWLLSCGRLDDAQAMLADAALHRASYRPGAAFRLAHAEAQLGLVRDGDDAALSALQEAEALAVSAFAPGDPRIALAPLARAQWLSAQGREAEAAALARSILAAVDGGLVPGSPLHERIRRLGDPR